MNTLPRELKKYFRPLTSFLLTAAMLLAFSVSSVQAQDDDPPVPDAMPALYYFQVGDEKVNEITLAPGENFVLKVGFSLIGPCDGATATILWNQDEILIPGSQVTNLIGNLLPFGFWNVISQDIGHLSFTQAMLGGYILPPEDGQGGYVETDYLLMEFQVNVPEGSTWYSSDINFQINSDTVDYSALTFYGASLVDYDQIPTFTVYNSEAAVDCEALGLNIGDACDDGDDSTENDVVNENCECAGTPIELPGCENTSLYPTSSVTPNGSGAITSISTCNYLQEYSVITGVEGGYEYTFAGAENTSGNLAYITVRTGAEDGPVVGAGVSPLTITAPSDADLFIHWNTDGDCGTNNSCATTTVICATCATLPDCEGVPGGPAQPGTACDDGDAGTVNEVYDADCNCGGGIPVATNDEACIATALACGDTLTQSLIGSTASLDDACFGSGTSDVWFNFSTDGTQIVTVSETSSFDAVVQLFVGDECGDLVEAGACKDGPENYTVTEAGNYYFRVRPYFSSGNSSNITVTLSCVDYDCPESSANFGDACDDLDPNTVNDVIGEDCECAGTPPTEGSICELAFPIECNADPVTYSSVGSNGVNTTACSMGSKGLWFSFVGTGGDITVNSTASFDHRLSVNVGECGDLTSIVCRDLSVGAENHTIPSSVLGATYYVYIAHYSSTSSTTGDITIDIDCATPPACVSPELSLTAQDVAGAPIEGCLDAGTPYYVLAALTGGEGNDSYNVSANGGAAVEVEANGSVVLGPFSVGANVSVVAVGAQDDECDVTASINSPAICSPGNDSCIDATAIACGETLQGTTVGATVGDMGYPACASGTAADVFYTLEALPGVDYTITVNGADYDGVLAIYSGPCDDLTELDCADNGFSAGVAETIEFSVDVATTITIRTYDWSSTRGSFTISVSCEGGFECPDLNANIGDACDDGNADTENDIVTENCECVGTPIVVIDCPDLNANIGDACDDGNADTENDIVTENCECVGTPIVVIDCPDLDANIGDACDDGNADTENDIVTENCECVGTPIVVEYDCPDLALNFGDACNDGDDSTSNDIIREDCSCAGTPVVTPECNSFVYYISDHDAADGISDIYGVTLSGGVATMTYIATSEIEIHIAFNSTDNLIYAVSKHENSYRTLDPATGEWGDEVSLGGAYGELTAAVFNAEGKLLIGSQDYNAIFSVNVATNVVSPYDSYSPVTGGDLAFGSDGMLYLATRSGNGLYQNWPSDVMPDILIGNVPSKVTGLAITDTDELLVSAQGQTSLQVYSTGGANIGSYTLELNGEAYTLRDGDMASGCSSEGNPDESCVYSLYYAEHIDTTTTNIYGVVLNDDNTTTNTLLTTVDFRSQAIGVSPEGLLFIVEGSNAGTYVIWDVNSNSQIGGTINIETAEGVNINNITAAVYHNGTLFVGSAHGQVYGVNPSTGITASVMAANVAGGDLVFDALGDLWLVNRYLGTFYNLTGGGSFNVDLFEINGVALLPNGNFIVSLGNEESLFYVLDPSTGALTGETYDTGLSLFSGDLAGICVLSGGGLITECYASEVLEFSQGLQTNGSPVAADRSDENAALGQPDASNAAGGFVSLGVGGYITLGFGGVIYDGPGNDIRIWETSFSGDVCGSSDDEQADIAVSQDGVTFVSVGSICRDGEIDIAGTGLDYVSAIRITNSASTGSLDGYDVDGVEAIHGCSEEPLIENGDCYATEVVEYIQGTSSNGGSIALNRTNPDLALGAPERVDQLVFVSLGYGGSLTLAFDGAIPNGPGDDIEIVETTYGNNSCNSYFEYADIYVSIDGVEYFFAKTVCRADGFVDISDAGDFDYVNFVRVVNNNEMSTTPDAFDVDGVVALHNCEDVVEPRPFIGDPQSSLSSFPNPTSGLSEVTFVTGETTRTLVEVYDISGRNVATIFNAEAQEGVEYKLDFDGAALPNGVYIYRMTTETELIINKFMIAK